MRFSTVQWFSDLHACMQDNWAQIFFMFKMDLIFENSMARIQLNSYLLRGKWSNVAVPLTNKTCPKCSDRKSRPSSNPGRTERTIEMRWGKQCMDDGSFQDIIIIPIHLAKMQVFANLQPISDVIRLLDYCTFALLWHYFPTTGRLHWRYLLNVRAVLLATGHLSWWWWWWW